MSGTSVLGGRELPLPGLASIAVVDAAGEFPGAASLAGEGIKAMPR
jgi:hypothetical protein